jgi:hypothetical protein
MSRFSRSWVRCRRASAAAEADETSRQHIPGPEKPNVEMDASFRWHDEREISFRFRGNDEMSAIAEATE